MIGPFVISRDASIERAIERMFDPARVIERASLPTRRGADLMAMADIEKSIVNKRDWRRTRAISRRDFAGSLPGRGVCK